MSPLLTSTIASRVIISYVDQFERSAIQYLQNRKRFFAEHENRGLKFIEKHVSDLAPSSRILDVGCGGGNDIEHFSRLGFTNVVGIDPSVAMLREATQLLSGEQKTKLGSWESIPYPDEFFDAIVADYSLHYCVDLDKAYQEAFRVLRPNGILIVTMSHPIFDSLQKRASSPYIETKLYKGMFEVIYPPHTLTQIFSPRFLMHFKLRDLIEFKTATSFESEAPTGLGFAAARSTGPAAS